MNAFNLESALAGAAVVTRTGRKVRIICTDRLSEQFPIVALVEDSGLLEKQQPEGVITLTKDGKYDLEAKDSPFDLFMAPTTKWVNMYINTRTREIQTFGTGFDTKAEAEENIISVGSKNSMQYIATTEVEV